MIKSGAESSGLAFNKISKLLFKDVNLSDKDSAIRLGAIIRIDFLVSNSTD